MTDVRLTATNPEDSSVVPVACNAKGELKLEEPISFDGNLDGDLDVTGSASFINGYFGGDITAGDFFTTTVNGALLSSTGSIMARQTQSNGVLWQGLENSTQTSRILASGSALFAGGKAGFTAEGNLWCTTVRGDTVVLDATSNGIGSWQPYTPPTRRELLEERITEIRDAAVKPSQELPETETGTQ